MKKLRKHWKLALIVILALAFGGLALALLSQRELRKGIQEIQPEVIEYAQSYQCAGRIVPRLVRRYPYEGSLQEVFVRFGQEVSAGARLAQTASGEGSRVIAAGEAGTVYEITEGYIAVADLKDPVVRFTVPPAVKEALNEGQAIEAGDVAGQVTAVSAIPEDQDGEPAYPVQGRLVSPLTIGTEVLVRIPAQPRQAWRIPLSCLVASGGSYLVVFPSWLAHTAELEAADYAKATVYGLEGSAAVIAPLAAKTILSFSGVAASYIGELAK